MFMIKSRVIENDIRNIVLTVKKDAEVLNGKTVLITGGSGFLGKYILYTIQSLNRNILTKPCKVISLDNYITGVKDNFFSNDTNFMFVDHDVRKRYEIKVPIHYVIHAAGLASPVYYMKYPLETLEVATIGTKHMLEFAKAKKVRSFLFFSSSEIYGDPDPNFVPTPEHYLGNVSCTGPRACYDESKRLGETFCTVYHRLYKLPVKIVRPFNVYGPGEWHKGKSASMIYQMIQHIKSRGCVSLFGDGEQSRDFISIHDVVDIILFFLYENPLSGIYNVGTGKAHTYNQIAGHIFKALGVEPDIQYDALPENLSGVFQMFTQADISKLRAAGFKLSYAPYHKAIQRVIKEMEV